ncbi:MULTISPECIES: hypothetical protein [Streptomyces]|uniref:Histidine kinase/HSP90-like ATPase domain-containing protein n=2 Tax=Streptomyces TaxID=1883 RepID=A0ABU4JZH8_9ACTN|nr:hypothetical protein [Streptomyces roseolus]MDX2290908.1 hypothetical protein [Streptomyces roseolus]
MTGPVRRCELTGPGAAARARAEVHRLADEALLAGLPVSEVVEGDAALVASELVAHTDGDCALELALTAGGMDIRVASSTWQAAPGGREHLAWWGLLRLLARDMTVRTHTVAGVTTVRVQVADAGPGC